MEFFQARRGERCYLLTRSYRSFAHWFYARTTEAEPEDNVLVRGPIDRPVYLVTRITAIKDYEAVGTFRDGQPVLLVEPAPDEGGRAERPDEAAADEQAADLMR